MSDRLPRKPRGTGTPVGIGEGNSHESPGVDVPASDGSAATDAQPTPGVRFLSINGVLGPSDSADDVDSEFSRRWPALWEYVTCTLFRGVRRQTATLLFFREDGSWKLCVSDRDTERVLFRSGDTVEDCLDAAEKALESPRADWRASRRGNGRK